MKGHVSRRSLSFRLDTCFVLCFSFVLLFSLKCDARIVKQESSVARVDEVPGDLNRSPLEEISLANEAKSSENTDAVNEKRHRRVSETLIGKSDTENEGVKVRDASDIREISRKNEEDETVERHFKEDLEKRMHKGDAKNVKRLFKIPIRRLKRDDQNVSNEKVLPGEKIENKDDIEKSSGADIEGIRRLDVSIEEENKKENLDIPKVKNIVDSEQKIEIKSGDSLATEAPSVEDIARSTDTQQQSAAVSEIDSSQKGSLQNLSEELRPDENPQIASNRADGLQFWRAQALEFQQKIRDKTFLQSLKDQMTEALPGIPNYTENQFLDMLKSIHLKKNIQESDDFNEELFKDIQLNDQQKEVLKCSQQLVAPKERPSFMKNLSDCIRSWNVFNCMRIFIYPIIVDYMPEALMQRLPQFPIEINVRDMLQGNREKPKLGRQFPFIAFYANPIDPDTTITNILTEGLSKNPSDENLPSFIAAKNETLSKFLTCNRVQILQMTEKFLPENARKAYSDEMLSCITRFEYFSCLKYFSWPEIRKYYSTLPEFPLNDAYLASLIYPEYPIITFPGFENLPGHLPEVIDSGPRLRPETIIINILKKTLSNYLRFPTPPTPLQLDLMIRMKAINQEQMATIREAEQLLPVSLRSLYVSRMVQCIGQFDYYNCMKYATWPTLRQFNPSLPEFPNFQEIFNNFQIPEIPGISNIFDFFSQLQLPQFEIPQFQPPDIPQFQPPEIPNFNFTIPDISNFSFPNFSTIFPSSQQNTLKSVTVDPLGGQLNRRNLALLEPKIYKILKDLRDSMGPTPLSLPTYTNRKVFLFPLMSEDQSKIFALAESIVPPMARESLITNTFFCLNNKNEFTSCMKTIVWPSIKLYVKVLPDFPLEDDLLTDEGSKKDIFSAATPGNKDNFFIMREFEKIFINGREDAMSYIIRNIQLSSLKGFDMPKLMDLLRAIQFNAPEFLNRQWIRYPRRSEFVLTLTENQENIVHAVESILPDQIRFKFYNDMIDCSRKHQFQVCSRNVIFPSIYPYFQQALYDPQYNLMPTTKDFSKVNNADRKITPVALETQAAGEKQGENVQNVFPKIDKRISDSYNSNPELVIFGMCRKIQATASSLPEYPRMSIAYTPEFKEAFSPRQVRMLILVEAILPPDLRTGFLDEMYKCNRKDTFLNCTRDLMFPLMKKAYPEFPNFIDFKNALNKSSIAVTLDSLKEAKNSSHSYDSQRTLPYMDLIIKFAPQDKSEGLKLLVDRLPDALYYDLYVKMIQCTKYSDGISCGRDLIYPVLKQYYDSPNFNVDDYYPVSVLQPTIASQRAPVDYEVVCENLGFLCSLIPMGSRAYSEGAPSNAVPSNKAENSYIPFGKLSDGSRVFKRIQDIWNLNITPSVGTDKIDAARQTGNIPTNIINLMKRSLNSATIRKKIHVEAIKEYTNRILKRTARNVDSNRESEERRNFILKRNPSRIPFSNLTESEILQILVNMVQNRNDRISESSATGMNEYFVDSLNDTEKALITADQYEILKLVQGLNSETAKASFMSRVVQCIRSLSFIRCIGIFVWPMITSNLPFGISGAHERRAAREMQIQNIFGSSPFEFEAELLIRKRQIESNLVEWYKSLMANKFEANIGPVSVNSLGDGEFKLSFSGYREGRLSRVKDHKSLPSILTIITDVIEEVFDTKPDKPKARKDGAKRDKKERSLRNSAEQELDSEEHANGPSAGKKRYSKDDQVINLLLDKLRPTVDKDEDGESRDFGMQDAYRAFQVLFGPKISEQISDELKSINAEAHQRYREGFGESKSDDDLDVVPLEKQSKNCANKFRIPSLKEGRAMQGFENDSLELDNKTEDQRVGEKLFRFKSYLSDYLKHYWNSNKKRVQTGLVLRLPRLNDKIMSRKITNTLASVGRSKMGQVMPGAGLAVSFLVQLFLAHTKAIASVSGILSNMALGSAMLGLMRDMLFGQNPPPKIKYVYDTDEVKPGISWPAHGGPDAGIHLSAPNRMHTPSPHFHY